jgi:hypothetical protein
MKVLRLAAILLLFFVANASAVFTYDFPGSPGSGLAADQTTPQPPIATYSDFTRNNVNIQGAANIFDSKGWSTNTSIDTNTYVTFSITAAPTLYINLSSLTFDAVLTIDGPPSGQVSLFVNGSATPYASTTFSPTLTLTNFSFNFTPLTDADLATTVEFRFYGWNAVTNGGPLGFDNVTTSVVPEPSTIWAALVPLALALHGLWKRVRPSAP